MAEELTRVLERRAERGVPRGAAPVLAEARQRVAVDRERRLWWRSGPAIAVAAFSMTLLVVGMVALALRQPADDTTPVATAPEAPVVTTVPGAPSATTVPTVPATTGPGPEAGNSVRLEPVEALPPVRLSTAIGEIEFTTWVRTDGQDPPLPEIATDHGVIGDTAWSLDGVTWTRIALSIEPTGWSDQTAANGDDLYAFVDNGIGRMAWDGASWVEAETFPAPRTYGGAAGPHGIVGVHGEQVYYWDGAEFAPASEPPDRSLYPGPGAYCYPPGIRSSGIMAELGPLAATDDGFVALAARSNSGWFRTPVCEPLVWLSADGDTWTATSDESPFGADFFVLDMAVAGGKILVAGGVSSSKAAVWVSDDGGISWQRASLEAARVWQVAGGARGWIAVGDHDPDRTEESRGDMWFSTDGLVWDGPYQRPPGWADATGGWATGAGIQGVAMLDDRIIGAGWFTGMPTPPGAVVIGTFIDE